MWILEKVLTLMIDPLVELYALSSIMHYDYTEFLKYDFLAEW